MAIPTPKVPMNRNSEKKWDKWSFTSKPMTQKKLPTPPNRELHTTQKKKNSRVVDVISTLVSLFIIIAFMAGLRSYRDQITSYLESQGLRGEEQTVQNPNAPFVGKEINLEGLVSKDNNQNYTHSLMNDEYGLLALRSSTINLNDYIGATTVEWQIVDFIDNVYIVEVVRATSLNQEKGLSTGEYVWWISYFPEAHIIVRAMEDIWITMSRSNQNPNILSFLDTTTQATATVRYFTCDTSVDHDCKRFAESFQNTVGIDFADSFSNVFYRLKDANTWFVSLDNKIGMYLETTDPAMIPLLVKNMQFITNNRVSKIFDETKLNSICQSSESKLWKLLSLSLVSYDGESAVEAKWELANCLIAIDPTNSLNGKLISISSLTSPSTGGTENVEEVAVVEEVPEQKEEVTNTVSNLSKDGVTQIPLKPGKELKFTSKSLWYTLVFPTPAISYNSFSMSDSVAGLSCRIGTRVVWYANKSELDKSPSLVIYGCKQWKPQLSPNMLSFDVGTTTFIVEVNDKAWIDFANNIKVEEIVL